MKKKIVLFALVPVLLCIFIVYASVNIPGIYLWTRSLMPFSVTYGMKTMEKHDFGWRKVIRIWEIGIDDDVVHTIRQYTEKSGWYSTPLSEEGQVVLNAIDKKLHSISVYFDETNLVYEDIKALLFSNDCAWTSRKEESGVTMMIIDFSNREMLYLYTTD